MSATLDSPPPLSRRKRILFSLILGSFVIVSSLGLIETALRLKKFRPWQIREPYTLEPAGSYFVKHPTLGYMPKPGQFKITIPGPFTFSTTTIANGLRITQPLNTDTGEARKEIWIFGCSFTRGWTLNDDETYAWLLQGKFTDYKFLNFGLDGGSTLQSLIQFREALERGKPPAWVIVAYGSLQDMRNTGTRRWMKARMSAGGHVLERPSIPYMRLSNDNKREVYYAPLEYRAVPFSRYSALANLLDETYNDRTEGSYNSHEVSKKLIEDFANLCKANGINFVVAGITLDPPTTEMLEYCRTRGIMTVDMSVNLSIMENTNRPYDGHPSALANQQYARKLELFLCSNLIKSPACARE